MELDLEQSLVNNVLYIVCGELQMFVSSLARVMTNRYEADSATDGKTPLKILKAVNIGLLLNKLVNKV